MANEAYIYRLRTDLGAGAFQITDLLPNTSRRAFSYQSYGQSGYLPAAAPGVSATNPTDDGGGAGGVTTNDSTGLAAYMLGNTNDGTSGQQITAAQAIAAETTLLGAFASGTQVTETEIEAALVGAGCGADTLPFPSQIPGSVSGTASSAGGVASVGTRNDFYKALFSSYTLPTGSVSDATVALAAAQGSFDDDDYRQLYMSGAMNISLGQGDLATFCSTTFSYGGVAGAAAVVYGPGGLVVS
ncbi:MAG: hypothetical protein CMJ67_10120 [Planctomycetaceae bacterium]|nr:hypothetical protein [Planctomycetaceae bacterium]